MNKQVISQTLALILAVIVMYSCTPAAEEIVGNEAFVHLEKIDGIWWLVDGKGEKFVSTGMNHIQSNIRFADYNKAFWAEKFGEDILLNGNFNPAAIPEVKNWMAAVSKDHKDYGFNTIPFHRALNIPDTYFEDLEIYYLGKIKTGIIHAGRVKWLTKDGKFPDVFSDEFRKHADQVAKEYCSLHKDNKFLLGYSYEDLPAYEYQAHMQQNYWNRKPEGFLYHPWVADLINVNGMNKAKKVWLDILKKHYSSAEEAAQNYGVEMEEWDDIASISSWPEPLNKELWLADQEEMSKAILDTWHRINREVILKYDPNHLILGDKIFCHGKGHPDWVFETVGKYVDVLLIQDYEMLKASHIEELKRYHELSGKPVLNGDASYAYTVEEQEASKGLQVESHEAVGEEYSIYLKGIMNLPFMVGWHNCGYLEQWTGGRLDDTGKQQTGLFDPFGKPRSEALDPIKQANLKAIEWHENATKAEYEYSNRKMRW
jgi:hypothetical protein